MGKNSFTTIEIVVVVGIITFFSIITIPRYNDFQLQTKLKSEAKKFGLVLNLARKNALSSKLINPSCSNFQGYRVSVSAGSYILKFLCSALETNVQTTYIQENITVSQGIGNIDFSPIEGKSNITVNTVRFRHEKINKCIDVSVSSSGIISVSTDLIDC